MQTDFVATNRRGDREAYISFVRSRYASTQYSPSEYEAVHGIFVRCSRLARMHAWGTRSLSLSYSFFLYLLSIASSYSRRPPHSALKMPSRILSPYKY